MAFVLIDAPPAVRNVLCGRPASISGAFMANSLAAGYLQPLFSGGHEESVRAQAAKPSVKSPNFSARIFCF
jgi:hypothetical protein